MVATARKLGASNPAPKAEDAVRRLLARLGDQAKHGACLAVAGRRDARLWERLEGVIHDLLRNPSKDFRANSRWARIHEAAIRTLRWRDGNLARRAAYLRMVEDLLERAEAGIHGLDPATVHQEIERALLWGTAWHLLEAGVPMKRVLRVMNSGSSRQGLRSRVSLRVPRPILPTMPPSLRQATLDLTAGTRSAAAELAKHSRRGFAAYQAAREDRQRQQATRPVPPAARPPRVEPVRVAAPVATTQQTAALNLDGRRLRGSVLGTWVTMGLLSWVSLFWGALISAPMGVGLVMAATVSLGIFIVPLWGTFWGFLGMNAARSSTLRQMDFKAVDKDHPLYTVTADLAAKLDLPPPTVGTVPAYNAFAMGIDHQNATVALGTPLLERLSDAETAAVIGHELGHIVSGDMRRMMLMRTFQNAMVWFGLFQGLKQAARWMICWAAELSILKFSRKREYWADAIGAALAGKEAMIGALRKLEAAPELTSSENTHARFMMRGRAKGSWFSTHPTFNDRIRALEEEHYIRRLPLQRPPR